MKVPVARPHDYLSLPVDLEFHSMAGLEAQEVSNFLRDGDLSLAG
jgi:hypothetical protein